MTEMKDDRQQRGGIGAIIIGVALMLVYVLSYGPAEWLVQRGHLSPDTESVIYRPLIFLGDRFDWIRTMLDWYSGVWA
jgi:hypothetical protein